MLYRLLRNKYESLKSMTSRKALNKTAAKLFSRLPQDNDILIEECDKIIKTDDWIAYQIVTL
ncbi:MAG: hypothetical protein R6U52_09705 [Kosmotogaceae bacterium]